MEIKPSPLPGWAWDLIERVEHGERRLWDSPASRRMLRDDLAPHLVREIVWQTRRGTRYDRMLRRAEAGKIKSTPSMIESLKGMKDSHTKYSSGHAWSWGGRIAITAGSSEIDQRLVLLHELAHLLAPVCSNHNAAWRRIVGKLYAKYGGPEMLAWAQKSERSPILRRYLRARYPLPSA